MREVIGLTALILIMSWNIGDLLYKYFKHTKAMPSKPKKVKRSWMPDRKPFEREKRNSSFYNSNRWRKVAKQHKESNPLCVRCEEEGRIVPVEFTDHIKRIEDGGDRYDYNNLQSLCAFHHNSKSGKEAHGYKGV